MSAQPMDLDLGGKRIAILATDGFEHSELVEPRDGLVAAGARVDVISPRGGGIRGWAKGDWAATVESDLALDKARARDYDALVLPGGVMNPDKLRLERAAIDFIRKLGRAGKPVAAICHGPWLLIDAGLARERQLTSWPSLRCDLENAGAQWEDSEVVIDGNIITSRKPEDIPAFTRAVAEALAG